MTAQPYPQFHAAGKLTYVITNPDGSIHTLTADKAYLVEITREHTDYGSPRSIRGEFELGEYQIEFTPAPEPEARQCSARRHGHDHDEHMWYSSLGSPTGFVCKASAPVRLRHWPTGVTSMYSTDYWMTEEDGGMWQIHHRSGKKRNKLISSKENAQRILDSYHEGRYNLTDDFQHLWS